MPGFLGENFLLSSETARRLYFDYAEGQPIIDYHCHVSPKEIWEDKRFENLTQVWLSGDHYKWRLLRADGAPEELVTGSAPDWEKFLRFAQVLPKAVGNPLYHWCHLELKNYFGYTGVLNGDTAREVWELAKERLSREDMSARGLIRQSNVAFIGTTDDPTDSLEYHEKLRDEGLVATRVAPSFRPDKALCPEKEGWLNYVDHLGVSAGVSVNGIDSLEEALRCRMDRFDELGCRASDHGLDHMAFVPADRSKVDAALKRGLVGEKLSPEESEMIRTALLLFCAGEYARRGWVMQIHYNCMRNPNSAMFRLLGPDTGFDCVGPHNGGEALRGFLDTLYEKDSLPRTVVYSLDKNDNVFLDSLLGSFQGTGIPGKLQHGSAWWFNDTKQGMLDQLTSLASTGLLGNFIGMLTDSRSFLSYARHEYFRRILCGLLGGWVESGECPNDVPALGRLVQDVCFNNAARYFGLKQEGAAI